MQPPTPDSETDANIYTCIKCAWTAASTEAVFTISAEVGL